MRGILALAFAAGCYSPHYEDCLISCASNACPSGLECRAGVCRSEGATGDCTVLPGIDAAPDSPVNTEAPWATPTLVSLSMTGVFDPSLTGDMLEMYVMKSNVIYVTNRSLINAPWSDLTPINISGMPGIKDQTPSISSDGHTLMLNSDRTPTIGGQDIWVTTRQSGSLWPQPTPAGNLNSAVDDSGENMSLDQHTIVFASTRANNMLDLYMASRADLTMNKWDPPTALDSLNVATFNDAHPIISPDLLTIYFQSNRNGSTDLFTAHRANATLPFDPPTPITELNTPMSDGDPWVSADGKHMFFSSNRGASGTSQIWETTR